MIEVLWTLCHQALLTPGEARAVFCCKKRQGIRLAKDLLPVKASFDVVNHPLFGTGTPGGCSNRIGGFLYSKGSSPETQYMRPIDPARCPSSLSGYTFTKRYSIGAEAVGSILAILNPICRKSLSANASRN